MTDYSPKPGHKFTFGLWTVGYAGPRHLDAHAFRTENYEGVKDFARGCMRTYLILKEKAERFNADPEIRELLDALASPSPETGAFTPEKAAALKAQPFDRAALGARGYGYERLDHACQDYFSQSTPGQAGISNR